MATPTTTSVPTTSSSEPLSEDQQKLRKQRLKQLRKDFAAADADHSGTLDRNELRAYLEKTTGQKLTDEQLAEEFRVMDADNSGDITLDEWYVYHDESIAGAAAGGTRGAALAVLKAAPPPQKFLLQRFRPKIKPKTVLPKVQVQQALAAIEETVSSVVKWQAKALSSVLRIGGHFSSGVALFVGYEQALRIASKDDNIKECGIVPPPHVPLRDVAISGCVGGGCHALVSSVVVVRNRKDIGRSLRHLPAVFARDSLSFAAFFYTYAALQRMIGKAHHKHKGMGSWEDIATAALCGGCGGLACYVVRFPFDVVVSAANRHNIVASFAKQFFKDVRGAVASGAFGFAIYECVLAAVRNYALGST